MSVRYRGVTHRITYTPGPDGLQHFLETLQSIGIKVASASQVTFLCRSPDTGGRAFAASPGLTSMMAMVCSCRLPAQLACDALLYQPSPAVRCCCRC